jgi:acetate kinase
MTRAILAINAGSSTVKLALFTADGDLRPLQSTVWTGDALTAQQGLLDAIAQVVGVAALAGIGHRIVHGGPNHTDPEPVTGRLLDDLKQIVALAPNHLPMAVALVDAVQRRWPDVTQVACFDTGFHRDLPEVARRVPIPRAWDARGVRRYGFHGLSYESVISELRAAHPILAGGRLVIAHLGHGSSLAAVNDGKPVDTSMCFTPLAGPMMSTRSGDVDPGLVAFVAREDGLSADQIEELFGRQSGLLAVSGTTADMRTLLEREADDPRARLAVDMYAYQIKKWIGAFAAALGGLDGLIFTGGIGEHATTVRARISSGLEFLGRIAVHVIPTNEELMIARHTLNALRKTS